MEDRIKNAKNTVGAGLVYGKYNPTYLTTTNTSVYRSTGMDQIEDIINCGYVRPKGYGSRRDKVGDKVYWSIGGEGIYYQDKKKAVLEAPIDKVVDGQIGAIPLEDLTSIWIFDEKQNKYIDRIDYIKELYYNLHPIAENKKTL